MDRSQLPPAAPVFTVAKPYATFVQADRSTFKELVQRLTGQTAAVAANHATARRGAGVPQPPTAVRKPAFKPAHQHRAKLTIVRPERRLSGFVSPKALSPSSSHMAGPCILNKAADLTSPASALTLAEEVVMDEAEEKAVKERRLCLHPSSPSGRDGGASEPKLLPLFPLTSPYSKESSELRDI